ITLNGLITVRKEDPPMHHVVRAPTLMHEPAPVARKFYAETAEKILARDRAAAMRLLSPQPTQDCKDVRPTKRDRMLNSLLPGKEGRPSLRPCRAPRCGALRAAAPPAQTAQSAC